ncbi:hypothetical protein Hanom_Chr05g00439591 [Helianthus anomalus]
MVISCAFTFQFEYYFKSKLPVSSLRFGYFCHFSLKLKSFKFGFLQFHFYCYFGPKIKSPVI